MPSPFIADIPTHIQAAMAAGAASVLALADMAMMIIGGQIPSPEQAGQWSFYGVLIVAIIVLFTTLATVIWWGATKGLNALTNLTDALHKLNETSEKQVEFFDDIAKQAVRNALTNPPR
jgi:polyferredoxin